MAKDASPNTDLDYADTLWKAAGSLREMVDAAEQKHVVLGLLDRFSSSTRQGLRRQRISELNRQPEQVRDQPAGLVGGCHAARAEAD